MSDRTRIARKKDAAPVQSNLLQRLPDTAQLDRDEVAPIVQEVLSSSGQPLDTATREFMEPRFGHDFSQVRVHTDERAAESAGAVNALAYTIGRNVVFGEGQYEPETSEGKRLLAHELTHVVQQNASIGAITAPISPPTSPQEQEADRVAHKVAIPEGESSVDVAQRNISAQLQRLLAAEDDPIHQPLIVQYREKRGLPAGGIDQSGEQVGPSDAEIKYGTLRQAKITASPPENQQVSSDRANNLSQQPLPPNVTQQPTPFSLITKLPNPAGQTQLGPDVLVDSSYNFQLSFVARHWDIARFAVKGVPVDILHEPTMTLGVSFDNANFGTLMAQLAVSGLNIHIQYHGNDLIELALGQIGLGFDSTGTKILSLGAQAEIHSGSPNLSFTINAGGVLKSQNGKFSTEWSPLTFGILVHLANP